MKSSLFSYQSLLVPLLSNYIVCSKTIIWGGWHDFGGFGHGFGYGYSFGFRHGFGHIFGHAFNCSFEYGLGQGFGYYNWY